MGWDAEQCRLGSTAPVEKLERFLVLDEQDEDEDVGASIGNDEIDKDEET